MREIPKWVNRLHLQLPEKRCYHRPPDCRPIPVQFVVSFTMRLPVLHKALRRFPYAPSLAC